MCSITLETKVKALLTKEERFNKDLGTKDRRIASMLERTKTLEQEKAAALREAALARNNLRALEEERIQLISINNKLQEEKESLMLDVSV